MGAQGDLVLYLDPHESRDAPRSPSLDASLRDSHRPRALGSMRATELDPSMALGFIVRSAAELEDFLRRTNALGAAGREAGGGASPGTPRPPVLFTWSDELPSPRHRRVRSGAPGAGGSGDGGAEDWELL